MGYKMTLEKAGAEVLAYKTFGDYQGTWLAFVKYNNQVGIVGGSYGSCSGCDAFEAEFVYSFDEPKKYKSKYYKDYTLDEEITKEDYDQYYTDLDKKYAEFGKKYLGDIQTKEILQTRLDVINSKKEEDDWFDNETKEYLKWGINQFNKVF